MAACASLEAVYLPGDFLATISSLLPSNGKKLHQPQEKSPTSTGIQLNYETNGLRSKFSNDIEIKDKNRSMGQSYWAASLDQSWSIAGLEKLAPCVLENTTVIQRWKSLARFNAGNNLNRRTIDSVVGFPNSTAENVQRYSREV